MSIRELKISIPENLYLHSFRKEKPDQKRIKFLLEKINTIKHVKEDQRKELAKLPGIRAKLHSQIDSITKELELLYSKPMTHKKRIREQTLQAIRGTYSDYLKTKYTKAKLYNVLKNINCRLMEYIHEYRELLGPTHDQLFKSFIINNINKVKIHE